MWNAVHWIKCFVFLIFQTLSLKKKGLFSDLLPIKRGQLILLANFVETWHTVLGVALKMQEGILLSEESRGGGAACSRLQVSKWRIIYLWKVGLGVSRVLGKQGAQEWSARTQLINSFNPDDLWESFECGFHRQWYFKLHCGFKLLISHFLWPQ